MCVNGAVNAIVLLLCTSRPTNSDGTNQEKSNTAREKVVALLSHTFFMSYILKQKKKKKGLCSIV